jgi:hypothetical protein
MLRYVSCLYSSVSVSTTWLVANVACWLLDFWSWPGPGDLGTGRDKRKGAVRIVYTKCKVFPYADMMLRSLD